MKAEKLAFLTDIEGVYKNPKDPGTLISELYVEEAEKLMEDGNIGGGMLPKLQNCIDAIENGVSRVHILDGRIPPVSYTHLDVYKRQLITVAMDMPTNFLNRVFILFPPYLYFEYWICDRYY